MTRLDARLSIRNLHAGYGDVAVLKDLSLELQASEVLSVVGPSGSGKSTLIKAICGLADVSLGEILLDGRAIHTLHINQRGVGVVFQEYALFPTMSVFDNIAFPLRAAKKRIPRTDIKVRTERIAEFLGLEDLLARGPKTLSGGQQQRVALARALIFEPPLLLLDEPLAALDPLRRDKIQGELLNIKKLMTTSIVYVTHDMASALSISDKILLLRDGAVEQFGTPREIYSKPKTSFAALFTGQANFLLGRMSLRPDGTRRMTLASGDTFGLGQDFFGDFEGDVCLMFRPEDAEMVLSSPPGDVAFRSEGGTLELSGTVQSVSYNGAHSTARVKLGDGSSTCSLLGRECGVIEGDRVTLRLPWSVLQPLTPQGGD